MLVSGFHRKFPRAPELEIGTRGNPRANVDINQISPRSPDHFHALIHRLFEDFQISKYWSYVTLLVTTHFVGTSSRSFRQWMLGDTWNMYSFPLDGGVLKAEFSRQPTRL